MSGRVLPVNQNPYIKTFQFHALPIAAMTGENKETELFVINNFIQVIHGGRNIDYFTVPDYFRWPCLDIIQKDIDAYKDHDAFIQVMIEALHEGRYMYTVVNERYIPMRPAYMKDDFFHDILVHGYEGDTFYVLGHCDNGRFMSSTVSRDDLREALFDEARGYFFKANVNSISQFDVKLNLTLISDYTQSKGVPPALSSYEFTFGINAFRSLCHDTIIYDDFDFRKWDLFYENKRLMYDRICLFSNLLDINEIIIKYRSILERSVLIRMLALKYDVELGKALKGDNSKIKNKVVDNAMKLLDDEEIVLKELMQASAELLNAKSC